MSEPLLETERLRLFRMSDESVEDAAFMLRLLNEPDFIRNIGDRGVRTLDDAHAFLRNGPMKAYVEHGYGMYRVEEKASGASIGNCGLVRREGLDGPDLGYAFLSGFHGRGYALEAARAMVGHAWTVFGIRHLLAIVEPGNAPSIRLLQKLGFAFATMVRLPHKDTDLKLFILETGR